MFNALRLMETPQRSELRRRIEWNVQNVFLMKKECFPDMSLGCVQILPFLPSKLYHVRSATNLKTGN